MATSDRFYARVLVNGVEPNPKEKLPIQGGENRYVVNYNTETSTLSIDTYQTGVGVKFYPGYEEPVDASAIGVSSSIALFVPTDENSCSVLVVKRKDNRPAFPDHLAFPARYIQNGETPLNAALEQLEKSTGIPIKCSDHITLHSIIESIPDSKTHNLMFVFQVAVSAYSTVTVDQKFVASAQFMALSDIKEIIANHPNDSRGKFTPGIAEMLRTSPVHHVKFH
jgi:hypothetical protein